MLTNPQYVEEFFKNFTTYSPETVSVIFNNLPEIIQRLRRDADTEEIDRINGLGRRITEIRDRRPATTAKDGIESLDGRMGL